MLVGIARDPEARVCDLAERIGISQRGVQKILADLYLTGYLERERVGRRNHYSLNLDQQFRYPTEAGRPIRLLIDTFVGRGAAARDAASRDAASRGAAAREAPDRDTPR
ncbi:helix-turn-helix domain-containing protein [Nonomuraea candida]|uniref:helix-turn-helix domain-containing protein n=1 Tax=Nonomuraea candida TaxID=359159 RepID=UPI001FDEE5A6|nr:helix-turn-helix domain-containing protein [Nonomuraea candida]